MELSALILRALAGFPGPLLICGRQGPFFCHGNAHGSVGRFLLDLFV
ncbi:hypothetical protein D3OALGB2SA_4523 [Olavius algarvensis associated proteobacterium Delta 3]|nr:hypothetical protein D3OALGB2SA_4523 [Olavius algarvensis associated proteobacterium Delta 3]